MIRSQPLPAVRIESCHAREGAFDVVTNDGRAWHFEGPHAEAEAFEKWSLVSLLDQELSEGLPRRAPRVYEGIGEGYETDQEPSESG